MAEDLVGSLAGVGDAIKSGVRGLKNLAAPQGPGVASAPIGQDASGNSVRYNRDGSPPTPVVKPMQTNTGDLKIKKKF
jgi:hypothetical protein